MYVTVRVSISASWSSLCRPSYFLSRGDRTGSKLDSVETRRKTAVCFVRLRILSSCRNWREGRRKKRGEGLARGERNTGVLLSTAGNSAQPPPTEPQTRASIWASASRHLSLPHPSSSHHYRPVPLPLFSHISPSSLPSPSLLRYCVSFSFLLSFFSARKWTKLRRPRIYCALPLSYLFLRGHSRQWMVMFTRGTTFF